jgi:CheY-like chemotaxis protein
MNLEDEPAGEGFDLVVATDGGYAKAQLDAHAARFRVVSTTIQLPTGRNGWEVARHTCELVPDMPMVDMSGDSAHAWLVRGLPDSVMVPKPFGVAQILSAFATLLNLLKS